MQLSDTESLKALIHARTRIRVIPGLRLVTQPMTLKTRH